MKKLIPFVLALFTTAAAHAQTFPVQNLVVHGTASFANVPTSVTPALNDNSNKLATTEYVIKASSGCSNVLAFGGNATGTGDNSAAFAAALAASPSGRACVYFPAGTYNFNSQIGSVLPSTTATLSILGAGVGATTLQWPAGGGIAISMPGGRGNAVHIRDMSLLTGTTGGTAISLGNTTVGVSSQPTENSDITNVSMHGMDGYGLVDYWTYGVNAASWSAINFVGIQVYGAVANGDLLGYCGNGTGILVQGGPSSGTPPYGVIYNVIASQFNCLGVGFANGPYSQGAAISQSNFTAVKNGITAIAGPGNTQLTVIGNQFNASDNAIVDTIGMPDLEIIGNTFLVPKQSQTGSDIGISLQQVFSAQIVGNALYSFSAATDGATGIYVGNSPNSGLGALITGNTFIGFVTAITLAANSSFCNVQSNSYKSNTTNVSNTGTSNVVGGGSQ